MDLYVGVDDSVTPITLNGYHTITANSGNFYDQATFNGTPYALTYTNPSTGVTFDVGNFPGAYGTLQFIGDWYTSYGATSTQTDNATGYYVEGSIIGTVVGDSAPADMPSSPVQLGQHTYSNNQPTDLGEIDGLGISWYDVGPASGSLLVNSDDKIQTGSISLASTGPQPVASGTIGFTDTNPSALPAAAIGTQTATATGADGNAVALTSVQIAALEGDFSIAPEPDNTSSGTIDWTYAPQANDLSFLASGETAEVQSTVLISDEDGYSDTALVTVEVEGGLDTLTIVPSDKQEMKQDLLNTNDSGSLVDPTQTGSIGFRDLSQAPNWTVTNSSFTIAATGPDGTQLQLTTDQQQQIESEFVLSGSTGNTADGVSTWTFNGSGLSFIAPGETVLLTQNFTVSDPSTNSDTSVLNIAIEGEPQTKVLAEAKLDVGDVLDAANLFVRSAALANTVGQAASFVAETNQQLEIVEKSLGILSLGADVVSIDSGLYADLQAAGTDETKIYQAYENASVKLDVDLVKGVFVKYTTSAVELFGDAAASWAGGGAAAEEASAVVEAAEIIAVGASLPELVVAGAVVVSAAAAIYGFKYLEPSVSAFFKAEFSASNQPPTGTGNVQKGYMDGSTVFRDTNANGIPDDGEISTTTNENGDFALSGGSGNLVAVGGVDTATGLPLNGSLEAPAGSFVISPMTTLLVALSASNGYSTNQAEAVLLNAFQLPFDVDLLTLDLEGGLLDGDPISTTAFVSCSMVENTVALLTAAGGTSTYAAIAAVISSSVLPINLSDPSTVSAIVASSGLTGSVAAAVSSTIQAANALILLNATQTTDPGTLFKILSASNLAAQGATSTALAQSILPGGSLDSILADYTGAALASLVSSDVSQINLPSAVDANGSSTGAGGEGTTGGGDDTGGGTGKSGATSGLGGAAGGGGTVGTTALGSTPVLVTPPPTNNGSTTLLPAPNIAFNPTVTTLGSTVTLTGTVAASASATLSGVELYEGTTDFGPANLNPDGTWSFALSPGGSYTGITAVATDSQGLQTTAPSNFDLTTGITGQPYAVEQDSLDPATGAVLGSTFYKAGGTIYLQDSYTALSGGGSTLSYSAGSFFKKKSYSAFADSYGPTGDLTKHVENDTDGSHYQEVDANKQVVQALGSDTFSDDANGTHFVFHHGVGSETIYGFQAAGLGHDVLSLPSSDAGKLAQILAHATGDGQGDATLDLGHGDTITLLGVSVAAIQKHPGDFSFHA